MQSSPLQPHSLCTAIADSLRERILSHAFAPGSAVHDGELAAQYGVSRTPVREALKLLCHEGMLTAQPRRGMTVTVLSEAEIDEALQLRRLLQARLDSTAGGPGAQRLTRRLYQMTDWQLRLAFGPHHARAAATPQ